MSVRMQSTIHPLRRASRHRRGVILLVVLFSGLIILAMTGAVMRLGVHQTRDRQRYETYKDEFAAAEAAVNKTYAHIQFLITQGSPDFFAEVAAITPPVVEGFTFPQFSVTNTFDGTEEVTSGQWEGLELYRLRYNIQVRALKVGGMADLGDHPGVGLSQNLEITYIPLFNFAIFYDPIMEIAPGPVMDVTGRVHANGDAYFQSNNSLKIHGRTTVAGNIFHGRHGESGKSDSDGAVLFPDGQGGFAGMGGNDSGWLDSDSPSWTGTALERWGGFVKDSAHGVKPLSLPIPTVADNHDLIERADPDNDSFSLQQEKFEYKAGLKIIRESGTVTGYLQDGTVVPLTYTDADGDEQAIYELNSFYDERESKQVSVLDIDLEKMRDGNIVPANGILYVSNDESMNNASNMAAVRLVNATELPDSGIVEGFSVATDDPVYIKGDYNTVNQTLAMVAGDSVGILSNAWDDRDAESGDSFGDRVASQTTVNAVTIQGVVPSANSTYSGGVENYFRFLENWSGTDFVFSGSIIQLWLSEIALGTWSYGSPVYTAPNRVWSWDTALQGINGPPGAPRVFEINQFQWELENIFGDVES